MLLPMLNLVVSRICRIVVQKPRRWQLFLLIDSRYDGGRFLLLLGTNEERKGGYSQEDAIN